MGESMELKQLSPQRDNSFLTHALFFLAEINTSESLENVLEVLRQDEDYIELYLS